MSGTVSDGFLRELETRRDSIRGFAESMLLSARAAGRETLNEGEAQRHAQAIADLRGLNERIADIRADLERADLGKYAHLGTATSPRRPTVSTHVYEPATYQRGDHRRSYMRDLVRVQLNRDDTGEALERLRRHAQDVATSEEYTEYRDLSRVDGSGGYAVPPAWLMDQYIQLARPGRAFANLVQRQPLPGGTDSINIPKLLTGTSTAIQTADNQPVQDVDLTDTFINAPVRTISGQQGVAIQLIDQSPIAFDEVVFRDLVADYAAQVDRQVIYGTGTNGQVLGVDLTPGITTIAASAVTTQGVYSAIANAVQTVHTSRFLPPEVIVMHPRRWGWFLSLLDQQDRPLFLPAANSPMNVAGVLTDVASQQVVGQMHGLPVVTDPNISTTSGSGSPAGIEDIVYVLRASDVVLWESGVRARVLPETKAPNLTVLLQIFGYLAFSAARYPQSIVEITGLTAPTF
jgi:HK97 family phage major capsid protein